MAWIWADRVLDTSATTGTGSLVVSGTSPLGWRTFSTVCAVADTFYYTIHDPVTGAWETGEGTYSALNTVARTVVRSSSNAGALVSFAANTKNVFIDVIGYWFGTTLPAEITVPAGAVAYGDATGTTGVTGVLADLGWDVANKRLAIGGATPATTLDVRGAATVYSLATNRLTNTIGSVGFTPGDATHIGYVAFYNAAGTRQSYIGYSQPSIGYNVEVTGGYHNFTCLDGPSRFTLANNRISINSPDTLSNLILADLNTAGYVYTSTNVPLYVGVNNAQQYGFLSTAFIPVTTKTVALGDATHVWNGLHTASVVAYGATSGTITVTPPAVAGANTITWPAATGTVALVADVTASTPPGLINDYAGLTAPAGWLFCDGALVSRTTYAALFAAITATNVVTVTIASPAVFTWASNPLANGDIVSLETTGALPTGFAIGVNYYVVARAAGTFQLSATLGGAAINSSGTQSGVHTARRNPWGCGNGTTTFAVPDLRGRTTAGKEATSTWLTPAYAGFEGATLGAGGGSQAMQVHNHGVTDPTHAHSIGPAGTVVLSLTNGDVYWSSLTAGGGNTSVYYTYTLQGNYASVSIQNAGGGSSQNVQPTVIVNKIIKT